MSSIGQLQTFSDLYLDLESRVRVATGQTAVDTVAKRFINVALQDMHLGFDYTFPWAERQAKIQTNQSYNTGTVTVSQGSTSVAGTSTLWTTTNTFGLQNVRAGGVIIIGGDQIPYAISTVGGAGALTLDAPYADATHTNANYVYYEDVYALASDFLRPMDQQSFDDRASIDLISRTEFRRRYPGFQTAQRPVVASIYDYAPAGNTTPVRKIRFHPPPSGFMNIPYAYVTSNLVVTATGTAQTQFINDTDEPIVPLRYRHAIVLHALYNWYRDKKDDTRSAEAKGEYTDIMLRIASDNEIGSRHPQLRPRIQSYVSSATRPYSGGRSRRYDLNGDFDRMR